MAQQSECPGCGLRMPVKETATTHRYFNTSPECWDLYMEVLAIEYADPPLFGRVHQLTVDSYAAQHPGGSHPDKSVDVHLCGLYLSLVRSTDSASISPLRQRLIDSVEEWPHFPPPSDLGPMTVFDIALTGSVNEHAEVVQRWARSVWQAWSPHHASIAEMAVRHLRLEDQG